MGATSINGIDNAHKDFSDGVALHPFSVRTPGGVSVSGWTHFPQYKASYAPLLIAIHGGWTSSAYFNIDEEHSLVPMSKQLGIPVIAIDRPGYCRSSPAPAAEFTIKEQGRHLARHVLPFLWSEYGQQLGCSSLVIVGHSIGAAITISTAAYANQQDFPLAGIIISGCSSHTFVDWKARGITAEGGPIPFPNPEGFQDTANPIDKEYYIPALRRLPSLSHPIPPAELLEISGPWEREIGPQLASRVQVPVHHAMGEHDG